MPYYRSVGEVPRKRHSQFRRPDGQLYAEELVGEQGFFYESSLLYHRSSPNIILGAEAVEIPALHPERFPNLPLMPRMFQTAEVDPGGDPVTGRRCILVNDDVCVSYLVVDEPSPLYRNAVGDELVFIQEGSARLESQYGVLAVTTGDYVRVPKSCVHRWMPAEPTRMLILEGAGRIGLPDRFLSPRGQFLEHAPYSERDFRGPAEPLVVDDEEASILVKHRDGVTAQTFAHHPFDVVGWDGYIYPWAFSIYDYEPVVKRFHAPPAMLETFTGSGWVVCSFTPRPTDFDPTALPAPYAHASVDCDEMMLFVSGDYTIRAGTAVGVGSMTFHPAGWVHGPHPGGAEGSIGKRRHEEYAVMVDTFNPLSLGPAAAQLADPEYHRSWASHSAREE
jgi:homogentisate 1,2-dioxygenase